MKRPFPAKKFTVWLVVVLGLFVAADFAVAAVAEYRVAQKVQAELQLEKPPAVHIRGFPFLFQAVQGDFEHVEIRARGISVGPFDDLGVEADLYHVRVSMAQVLAGTADSLRVQKVVGRLRLKAYDIGSILGIDDLHILPVPDGALNEGDKPGTDGSDGSGDSGNSGGSDNSGDSDGRDAGDTPGELVKLKGTVNIAGIDNQVTVVAKISLVDGKVRIEPRELELANSAFGRIPLADAFEQSVLQRFSTTLDPGALPFTVTPTDVDVRRGALIVEGTARNLVIDAGGVSTG